MKDMRFAFVLLLLNSFNVSAKDQYKAQDPLLRQMTDSKNHYPGIQSVLIAKNNQLLYEQYFNGFMRDSRSSFKSIPHYLR